MISVEFLITSLIVVLIPGTGVIFTVSTGITQGRKAALYAAVGCTLGIIPHLLATILGLAALMHTSALRSRPSNTLVWRICSTFPMQHGKILQPLLLKTDQQVAQPCR